MNISRERLEALLQLKVVPGWTADGGNLRYELPQLHDLPPFNGSVFVYAPLKPPAGDFTLKVSLTSTSTARIATPTGRLASVRSRSLVTI